MHKVALIVGHLASNGGARNSKYRIDEYQFNNNLVKHVWLELMKREKSIEPVIIYRNTYSGLPDYVNRFDPAFAVSFHCNAFNKKARGTEVLYYEGSSRGRAAAEVLTKNISKALKSKNRGSKSTSRTGRGGYLLQKTKCPVVIAEPFFIDSNKDFVNAMDRYNRLVRAYSDSISQIAFSLK